MAARAKSLLRLEIKDLVTYVCFAEVQVDRPAVEDPDAERLLLRGLTASEEIDVNSAAAVEKAMHNALHTVACRKSPAS